MINELLHLTMNPEQTWVITKFFDEEELGQTYKNATFDEIKLLQEIGYTEKFRMYTDDDEVIYEGFAKECVHFEPLDDFGMPNYGCTYIMYYNNKSLMWEIL